MNIIKEMIAQMREDATTLNEMCSVYPGDIDSSMTIQAYLLDKAAGWLERINWETEEKLFIESLPKLTITYTNDNAKDPE